MGRICEQIFFSEVQGDQEIEKYASRNDNNKKKKGIEKTNKRGV